MKFMALFFFAFFITTHAHGETKTYNIERISSTEYNQSLLYQENNIWIYEIFNFKKGFIQSRVLRRVFANKEQAIEYAGKKSTEGLSPYFSSTKTEAASQAIWKDTNTWSQDWEDKYSKWIKEDVDKNFFIRHRIPSDCADVAVALRWIFSRIHSLPAAQSLAASGNLFTNRDVKKSWLKLRRHKDWRKDRLFRKSLSFLMNNTYTHSLYRDTYPVAINKRYLNEGAFLLTLSRRSGHTVFIHRQNVDEIPLLAISSTVPSTIRVMSEAIFIPRRLINRKAGGIVKPRWVINDNGRFYLKASHEMFGFSLEQYDRNFGTKDGYGLTVIKRINPNFNPRKIYLSFVDSLKNSINERIKVVLDGYRFCSSNDCQPGTQSYEDWSTPSRDRGIRGTLVRADRLLTRLSALDDNLMLIKLDSYNTKEFEIEGIKYNLNQIQNIWEHSYFQSDPWLTVSSRWSLTPSAFLKNIEQKIMALKSEKNKRLQKNLCSTWVSCETGDQKWLKSQTIPIDNKIKDLLNHSVSFCEWMGLGCQAYHLNYLKPLQIDHLDYSDFSEKVFFSSFDPRSSLEEKNGQWEELKKYVSIKPIFMNESKDYLVVHDLRGIQIVNLTTMQKIKHPLRGTILAVNNSSNSIVFYDENNLFYYNIDDNRVLKIANSINDFLIKKTMLFDNYFLVASTNQIIAGEYVNQQLKVHHSINLKLATNGSFQEKFDFNTKKMMLIINTDEKTDLYLYDLNSATMKTTQLKKITKKSDKYFVNKIRGDHLLLSKLDFINWNYSIHALNLKTWELQPVRTGLTGSSNWLRESRLAVVNSNQEKSNSLFIIDENFKAELALKCLDCDIFNYKNNKDLIAVVKKTKKNKPKKIDLYQLANDKFVKYKNIYGTVSSSNGLLVSETSHKYQKTKVFDLNGNWVADIDYLGTLDNQSKTVVEQVRITPYPRNPKDKYLVKTYLGENLSPYPIYVSQNADPVSFELADDTNYNGGSLAAKSSVSSPGIFHEYDNFTTWFKF